VGVAVSWRSWLERSVRRKLLAIALLPTVVMLPLVTGALLWWGDVVYDKLLVAKVRSDLAVAKGYFNQVAERVSSGTAALAGSQALLERVQRGEAADLDWFLEQQRRRLELDFLVVRAVGESAEDALADTGGVEVWTLQQLAAVSSPLARRAADSLPGVTPQRALVIAERSEVVDRGRRVATVLGGILLNGNLDLVDRINYVVYPEGALPLGSRGTATLFLDDVRVSTNVRLFPNERAIGTRAAADVRDAVLTQGRTWLDRARVVNDWYMSGYEPILDHAGRRVGMLYVGYLEEPFRLAKWGILGVICLIFTVGTVLTLFTSLRWAATIFRPVERMAATMRRVEGGEHGARVGKLKSQNEIGRLAHQLDALLEKLEENRATLERWAHELEQKVSARTRELAQANQSLQDTQRQLVQSERLAAIGQVTAAMAHEINNPVAVIQGNLDLIRELLGDHSRVIGAELGLLDQQVERMRTMVAHLLRAARPAEYPAYAEPIDLNRVVDESLVLSSHVVPASVQVVRELHATRLVAFDRQELQQLLVNLVANAAQAMPEGGTLTMATKDWDGAGAVAGAEVIVADTGSGIPPEIRDRLFLPQFTTRRDGNGLGLWISLTLVERHGGAIEVEDAPGGGALFRVRLLCAAATTCRIDHDSSAESA
jgi:signal transduction histidine kinase